MATKFLFVSTTSSSILNFRLDLIKLLLLKKVDVYVMVSEYNLEDLLSIEKLGVNVSTYKMNRGGLNPFVDIIALIELRNKINSIKPDIVFSYFTKPIIYGSLAAKINKSPKIIGMIEGLGTPFTEHFSGQSLKIKFIKFFQITLYRIVFPFIDKIIFLNKEDPQDLIYNNRIKHKKNSVNILGPIGLNLQDYSYGRWDESSNISFIFIARLIAEKGIFDFIEAAKIVKKKYQNIKFTIIGGLDTENPFGLSRIQLDELIASELIDYPGFVTDVAKRIQDSAVFVLPSYYREGVPRSTQEAMAVGRPVITTDVPGCRETVVDGVNGFLVPKWNPEALADKMCYFIENPEQVNKMGLKSYEIAQEKFDAEKVNSKLIEIMGLKDLNEKIS